MCKWWWYTYPIQTRRIDCLWRQADRYQSLWAFCSMYVLTGCFLSIFPITNIYCLAHLTQHSSNFIFTNMVTYQFVFILVFSLTQCVINYDKNIKRGGLVLYPHYAHTVLLFYPWTLIVLFNAIHLYRGLFINYISTKIKFSEWNFDSNLFLKSVIVHAQKTTFALFIVIKKYYISVMPVDVYELFLLQPYIQKHNIVFSLDMKNMWV